MFGESESHRESQLTTALHRNLQNLSFELQRLAVSGERECYAAESSIIAVKKIVMDAAIAGLIGAAIGAVAGMAGTLTTTYLQAKQEHAKWIRDKRVEAYSNTIRYLVRALNKRSSLSIEGGNLTSVMGKDVIKEWFDDLSEILVWLSAASIYCTKSQQSKIAHATQVVNKAVCDFVNSSSAASELQSVISSALGIVEECARQDVGRVVK
jgi:hypothetical protein